MKTLRQCPERDLLNRSFRSAKNGKRSLLKTFNQNSSRFNGIFLLSSAWISRKWNVYITITSVKSTTESRPSRPRSTLASHARTGKQPLDQISQQLSHQKNNRKATEGQKMCPSCRQTRLQTSGGERKKMNFLVNYTRNENNANRAALICPFTEIGKASLIRELLVRPWITRWCCKMKWPS